MTQVIFVRHGQTHDNIAGRLSGRSPVPLNDRGLEQARHASEALSTFGVSRLLSSPVIRARRTAEILAEQLQLHIEDAPDLREVGYGDWEGRHLSEMQGDPVAQLVFHDPVHARFPNGERLVEVQQRGISVVESVSRDDPHDVVVLVTHGDVISTTLAHYLNMPFNDYRHITVENGALSVLEVIENSVQVKAINVIP